MTASSARLLSDSTGQLLSEWRPSGGRNISVVTANRCQMACAVGSDLFYLEIENGEVVQKRSVGRGAASGGAERRIYEIRMVGGRRKWEFSDINAQFVCTACLY